MRSLLDEVVRRQKADEPRGVASVCPAHPPVIEATVFQARETGRRGLVEVTSNQVDRYGDSGTRPHKEYS